jgi:hypothetical protein
MSADTTPVILVTNGVDGGQEYRFAVAQAWENAWNRDDEGEVLNSRYITSVFERSPAVNTTIASARRALATYIETTGYPIEYDEQVLDLSVTRPTTNLERYLGHTPAFTFQNLVEQAEQ